MSLGLIVTWTLMLLVKRLDAVERILMVQVDNRGLPDLDSEGGSGGDELQMSTAPYWMLTPVLNHHYCRRHGYDYLLVHPMLDVSVLQRSGGLRGFDNSSTDGRAAVGAWHKGLGQARAASWAKLPTLLYLLLQLGSRYDRIWYLDSDIGLSDQASGRSVHEKIIEWNTGAKCLGPPRKTACVNWGLQDVSSSPMLLFPNSPFGDSEPCAGTFMFRPSVAASMLLEWWDIDMPEKNFGLMHEQDALWNLTSDKHDRELARAQLNFSSHLSRRSVTLLQEFQFPPNGPVTADKKERCVGGKQWICHLITTDHELRAPWFREMLARPENGAYSPQRFRAAVHHIRRNLMVHKLDMVAAAEAIERHRESLVRNLLDSVTLSAAEKLDLPRGLGLKQDFRF